MLSPVHLILKEEAIAIRLEKIIKSIGVGKEEITLFSDTKGNLEKLKNV